MRKVSGLGQPLVSGYKAVLTRWRKLGSRLRLFLLLVACSFLVGGVLAVAGTIYGFACLAAISKAVSSDPERAKLVDRHLVDLSYGDLPRHKLDIYIPKDADRSPVLVFIHGGAWKHGDKDMHYFVGESFAAEGIVTIIPNYRLFPEVTFPAFMHDAALAVKWVHDHAERYGGDPNRIILAGHSAGGHIVSLLGTDQRYLGEENGGKKPTWLKGVISLAGPVDTPLIGSIRPVFEGSTRAEAMPIGFVDPEDPRFLIVQGGWDVLVYPPQARNFETTLRAAGVEVSSSYHRTAGHGQVLFGFTGRYKRTEIFQEALAFIRSR